MTLTNHRPFQNRSTLDAKKMHFCSSGSRESRIFGISALKTIESETFSTCNWAILRVNLNSYHVVTDAADLQGHFAFQIL